jgi:hypothetical protein
MRPLSLGEEPQCEAAAFAFAARLPFAPTSGTLITDTPYDRPLDVERLKRLSWSEPFPESRLVSDAGLVANRLLMNVYEDEVLLLPHSGLAGQEAPFAAFYDLPARRHAEVVRPWLEWLVFDFLNASVQVTGEWTVDTLEAHITAAIEEAADADGSVLRAIEESAEPHRAAEMLVTQMALDGLTEATAMSQNLGGAYGREQSELFKIFINEFGYGFSTPSTVRSSLSCAAASACLVRRTGTGSSTCPAGSLPITTSTTSRATARHSFATSAVWRISRRRSPHDSPP